MLWRRANTRNPRWRHNHNGTSHSNLGPCFWKLMLQINRNRQKTSENKAFLKVLVQFANRKYIASLIIEYQKITYVVLKPLFSTPIFLVLPSNAAITKKQKTIIIFRNNVIHVRNFNSNCRQMTSKMF